MAAPPPSAPDTGYQYGRRLLVEQDYTGQPRYRVVALTPADYLDPQPGDEFVLGQRHAADLQRVAAALRTHLRYNPTVTVVTETKFRWPGHLTAHPAPDLALVSNLADPTRPRPIVDLAAEGARVRAVIEIVAPLFADADQIDRPRLYAAAGVPELWIIDAGLRPGTDTAHYSIHGFLLRDGTYSPVQAAPGGTLVSPGFRCFFSVTPDGRDFNIGDVRTGQAINPLPDTDISLSSRVEATLRAESIASQLDFLR